MSGIDYREMAGGAFVTLLGVGFASYAAIHYTVGTVTRMGPGMVPVALGVLLAVFGLVIIFGSFSSLPQRGEIRVFVPLVILGSVLAFALTIRPLGLLPAVLACTLVSTLAERKLSVVGRLVLAAVLGASAWLVFIVALQLPIALVNWPF
ncbi:tripartite tricarboxylate transporter TctB family protein [Cereibacter changlensis]|uniref:Tripartite tricarboxylate transporter TctB family protein n=1 Tax=Cereibacter changlensis TaxID=402884 RepID=A0A4U0YU09_9RHOB|nr:tripartite tricarboxylate transporter TctB family protein [Cereibacter changlensis]TKA96202.1 tripartite tricarboxylate transporter TctB family protein [Cereibacter changlensis]